MPSVTVAILALSICATTELADLTPTQRHTFEAVTAEEFCGCSSALTLSGCLELRPGCDLARDLSRIIIAGISSKVTADEMLAYLSKYIMRPFCEPPKKFVVDGAPFKGAVNAPITVVEFADFRCGHCRLAASQVKAAARRNGKDVRFVFMPFPLMNNPLSIAAAEAALAANAQGKFWEMHDALFDNQERGFDPKQLRRLAGKVGLDMKRFDADMTTHEHRAQIMAFKQQGLDADIDGTPAFFVNGRHYELDDVLYTFDQRFAMERHRDNKECK